MVPHLKSCAAQSGIKANGSDRIVQLGLGSAILKRPLSRLSHIFKVNFPEIVDLAPPAEDVFHNHGRYPELCVWVGFISYCCSVAQGGEINRSPYFNAN